MKAALIVTIVIASLLPSCSVRNERDQLSGFYSETSPAAGRSALEFLYPNRMVRHERNSSHTDTFFFTIDTGYIHLVPTWQPEHDAKLEIDIIDSRSFRIEYMYPATGFQEKWMMFEK